MTHFIISTLFSQLFLLLLQFLFKNIPSIHILNFHMSNFNVTPTCFVLKTNYPPSNKKRAPSPVLFHLKVWIRSSFQLVQVYAFYAGFIEIVNFCKSGGSYTHTHTDKQYKCSRLLLKLQIYDRKGTCWIMS